MFYVKDIKEFRLNEKAKYSVRDSTRDKYFNCLLVFQADYIFLFEIIDKDVADNKICISKVDYFLNRDLIKNKSKREEIKKHNIKFDKKK
mgnify:CR=1 FL=1|jgi:hypothetical protein